MSGGTATRPHPAWFEVRLPMAAECSPGHMLDLRYRENPAADFIVLEDGAKISVATFFDAVTLTAGRLQAQGVGIGDHVLVWLPTGMDMLRQIFALSMLRAVMVPLNPALRGTSLAHSVAVAGAGVMVAHPDLAPRLAEAGVTGIGVVIIPGVHAPALPGLTVRREQDLPVPERPIQIGLNQPWDIAAIIFSSGTTGPAKGVLVPYGQVWSLARAFYGYMNDADRMLLMYPLHHIAGFSALHAAMIAGGMIALTEAFKASVFFDLIRRTGTTVLPGLGPTFINILLKLPAADTDHDNSLRMVNVQTVTAESQAFAARFDCSIMGAYSMTETSGLVLSDVNATKMGAIGRPRDGLELRLVDGNDIEVPVGVPGEVVVRGQLPWTLNAGYHENPAATVAAWRNGWFHTGDVMKCDVDGDLFFVDRMKDVIRRRSENISSSDVETQVRAFPAVLDAAAIGVADDDEILIVVTAVPGHVIDPRALMEFLIPRMPHHTVPRYVRILSELPKTNTNRVQKQFLRQEGLTADCWDRHAAGMILRGQRLGVTEG